MVTTFPNPCLWRRSLCSNLRGIDPEKLYRATWEFLEVSRCSCAKQGKEMYKKSVLHVQILLIRPTGLFAVLVAVAV